MFDDIGVLYVDHIAVTTQHFEETIAYYLTLPKARLINGPGENHAQQVKFAFIAVDGMGTIEVLAPLSDQSPLLNHLRQGGGAYHFCYAVSDLAVSVQQAIAKGSKLISSAKPDDAFYGRSVAFLMHPYLGLFELLEAYPSYLPVMPTVHEPVMSHQPKMKISTKMADDPVSSVRSKIVTVFNQVMKSTISEHDNVTMQTYVDWDSVKHILLIMELEREFDIQVPSELFAQLVSIDDLVDFINNKISKF